ncbi:MAG TPA: SRPBCC domain-containing protein [Gammaproteobacteria bacterium]
MSVHRLAATMAVLTAMFPVQAEVIEAGPDGFLVRNEAVIAATPDKIYATLTRSVGRWWDSEHTYSGDARNMRIDLRPGGCFCEKIPGKGAIEHARVIYASKNEVLRLSGALGPLQESGLAGTLTWTLKAEGGNTTVTQNYSVGGFWPGGLKDVAALVGGVLEGQLQRLKRYVETGNPASE